jgi:hypothetical protein
MDEKGRKQENGRAVAVYRRGGCGFVLAIFVFAFLAMLCYDVISVLRRSRPQLHIGESQVLVGPTTVWLFAEVDEIEHRASALASPPSVRSPKSIIAAEIGPGQVKRVLKSSVPHGVFLHLFQAFLWHDKIYLLDVDSTRVLEWDDGGLEEMSNESSTKLLAALGIGTAHGDARLQQLKATMNKAGWHFVEKDSSAFCLDIRLDHPRLHIWWRESKGREQIVLQPIQDKKSDEQIVFEIDPNTK